MSKFITPVSMKVTEEQFNADLKDPLEDMGYSLVDFSWDDCDYFMTSSNNSGKMYPNQDTSARSGVHYIDHYNPQLFLALAAMTNEEYGIAGEWWVNTARLADFSINELYQSAKPLNQSHALFDNDERKSGTYPNNLKFFRKATKEELIAHLTISKQKKVTDLKDNEVIHCPTEEEAVTICDLMHKAGLKWGSGNSYIELTSYKEYEKNTCYCPIRGEYCKLDYYKSKNYTIYPASDFLPKEFYKSKTTEMKVLLPKDAQRIIDAACQSWKLKLISKWATDIILHNKIEISEDFYKEMRSVCTTEQNRLFDEIFGVEETWFPGELYWIKRSLTDDIWELRYASRERGAFYVDQHKQGNIQYWSTYQLAKGVKLPD